MLIYLDLDTNRLVISPGNSGLVGGYITPRGSGPLLRVQPVRAGQLVPLPSGFEMTWTVKNAGDFGGDMVAYADDFAVEAGTTVYSCAVNYETEDLDALLEIGQEPEKESVSLLAQLAWRPSDSDTWRPAQVVDLELHNSIWRGVPGAPDVTPDSFDWLLGTLTQTPGISFTINTEAKTLTIGLALTAGTGMTLTTDDDNKVVAQDVQYARATTDQDFFGGDGASGDMTDDNTLVFQAAANSVYDVDLFVRMLPNITPGSPTQSADAEWSLPSGAAAYGQWHLVEILSGSSAVWPNGGPMSAAGAVLAQDGGADNLGTPQKALIVTGGTAGTVKLRLRCNFQSLTDNLTRKAGSFLIARRIS